MLNSFFQVIIFKLLETYRHFLKHYTHNLVEIANIFIEKYLSLKKYGDKDDIPTSLISTKDNSVVRHLGIHLYMLTSLSLWRHNQGIKAKTSVSHTFTYVSLFNRPFARWRWATTTTTILCQHPLFITAKMLAKHSGTKIMQMAYWTTIL